MQEEKIAYIPVDEIAEPTDSIRTIITLENLTKLAESIHQKGVIEPLIVVGVPGKYEITAGHRRYLAAKMAGLQTVPCLVRELSDQDIELVKLHENYFREDVNPIDEGNFFVRLHAKQGLAYPEIAKLCCRSETYIHSRLQLLDADENVQAAMRAGQIGMSQALEIMKAEDPNIRAELLRVTVESGATVSSLRIMRHDYESAHSALEPTGEAPPQANGQYQTREYLYTCPVCGRAYPVQEIYPLSVCRRCHDNIIREVQKDEHG